MLISILISPSCVSFVERCKFADNPGPGLAKGRSGDLFRINPYAGITIREEVCFTHSPKRSLYYVCCRCLQLLVTRMTISDGG